MIRSWKIHCLGMFFRVLVVFPARSWHVIVVPIGLTLWSGQLKTQFLVIRFFTVKADRELKRI